MATITGQTGQQQQNEASLMDNVTQQISQAHPDVAGRVGGMNGLRQYVNDNWNGGKGSFMGVNIGDFLNDSQKSQTTSNDTIDMSKLSPESQSQINTTQSSNAARMNSPMQTFNPTSSVGNTNYFGGASASSIPGSNVSTSPTVSASSLPQDSSQNKWDASNFSDMNNAGAGTNGTVNGAMAGDSTGGSTSGMTTQQIMDRQKLSGYSGQSQSQPIGPYTLKAYDANNNIIYVKPGEYVNGASLQPKDLSKNGSTGGGTVASASTDSPSDTSGSTDNGTVTPQSALQNYLKALNMSPEEKAAQEELNNAMASENKGLKNINDQTIPMEYITGQAASLKSGAESGIANIQNKLALAQTARGLASTAAKGVLDYETTMTGRDQELISAGYVPAAGQDLSKIDPSRIITSTTGAKFIKPLTTATSPTGQLYSYNPVTNSVENLKQFGKLMTQSDINDQAKAFISSGQATTVEQANAMAKKFLLANGWTTPNGNTDTTTTTDANDPTTFGITQQQADSMLNDIKNDPDLLDKYAPVGTKSGLRSYLIGQIAGGGSSLAASKITNDADKTAYSQQLSKYATYQQADDNLQGNVQNVQPLINLVNTNPNFANVKINDAKVALGDENAKALQAGIDILSNDLTTLFAKGNVTDSVRNEAMSLIDPGITAGQFAKTWALLQKDIKNNKDSFQTQMKGILNKYTTTGGGINYGTGTNTNSTTSSSSTGSDSAFDSSKW